MNRVDKITGLILVVAIICVGVLAGFDKINGEAALGFISGIAVSLVSYSTAKIAVVTSDKKATVKKTGA